MSKIVVDEVAERIGSGYPEPFAGPCRERRGRPVGFAAGLTQFGVNLVTLPPGAWSSQRHWHAEEDEFVYVIEGRLTLVTDGGAEELCAGDCAGFPADVRNGHHLQNLSAADAVFLVVGSRRDEDWGEYPDIDMSFRKGRYSGGGGFERKNGERY